jgi:hypothetical protein
MPGWFFSKEGVIAFRRVAGVGSGVTFTNKFITLYWGHKL